MKTIKGFEGEELEVSEFGEWVGNDYIDYKFEYENNQKAIKELSKEYQKLVKQLEDKENQQKEFVNYLEDEIMEVRAKWGNALSNVSQLDVAMTVKAYEDILSKYKEIIGGDNK